LLRDLAHPHNALPEALRAQLLSIGLWILKDVARIRARLANDLDGLLTINRDIREGLR
jgi:flagellar protein FlaF